MITEENYYEELELIKVIKDEYKEWKTGENILMGAGMGSGKTTFALDILPCFAKMNDKKILILSNRSQLKLENSFNIDKNDNKKVIKNITYQKLEQDLATGKYTAKWLEIFDYIICDECHYFFTDSWNGTTDMSYNAILNSIIPVKIYMSATYINIFALLEEDISKQAKTIIKYNTEQNFNQVEKLIFYKQDEYVEKILIENLPTNEKLLYFSKNIKYLYELHNKYNNSSFVCSSSREEYKITKNALIDNKLTNQLTFATNVWDNGINIIDAYVKHVVIDISDLVTFIQCLGRRRQVNNDKFILYVRNFSNEKLNQYIFYDKQRINNVDSYIRNSNAYLKLARINKYKLDDMIFNDPDTEKLNINWLIYRNIKQLINRNKIAMEMGWDNYIKSALQIENVEYAPDMNIIKLKLHLDNIIGQKLFKEQQQELCDIVRNVSKNRVRGKTIQPVKLQKILNELNLNYIVKEKQDIVNNKHIRYIIINKAKLSV